MIIFSFMFTALASYIFGYHIGKLTAEEDIRRKRDEMGIDDEENKEDSEWNTLWP